VEHILNIIEWTLWMESKYRAHTDNSSIYQLEWSVYIGAECVLGTGGKRYNLGHWTYGAFELLAKTRSLDAVFLICFIKLINVYMNLCKFLHST